MTLSTRLTLAASACWSASSIAQVPAPRIVVGANVQVSASRPDRSHNESMLAIDPADPNRLFACSVMGLIANFGDVQTVGYRSQDGGKSWMPAAVDSSGYSGDPACTVGVDGRVYFVSLRRYFGTLPTHGSVMSSADGGQTWRQTMLPESKNMDREFIAVDHTNGPYRGRLYVSAWEETQAVNGAATPMGVMALWRSSDGGITFGPPVLRGPTETGGNFVPGSVVVLSDGTVAALFLQMATATRSIRVMTSSDGGESLNPGVKIDNVVGSSSMPTMAADVKTSAFRDRLYATWSDSRYDKRAQALLSYSTDKGRTWSTPRLVNDDRRPHEMGAAERGILTPTVAVNKDGVVGVLWQDRRTNVPGDNVGYVLRFAASFDGGETFTASTVVSGPLQSSHDNEPWQLSALDSGSLDFYARGRKSGFRAVLARNHWGSGGETMGLVADAQGVFHALWVDGRTGVHQMWTAPIATTGEVHAHGAAALADLDDLSEAVAFDLSRPRFDPASRAITVSARLRNQSKEVIRGALKVRATMIMSSAGVVAVVGADNGATGEGAVWDFTGLVPSEGLAPGGTTASRTLTFRYAELRSNHDWFKTDGPYPMGDNYPGALAIDGLVLGRRR